MKDFKDKVAVITGAGRGIGKGITWRCGKEGMKVVLAGPNLDSLQSTETELKSAGIPTLVVQTDVSKKADVERLLEETLKAFGKVHVLVNNAGVFVQKPVLASNYEDWDWVMGVNFMGVLYGVKTFVPRMLEQLEECHVVNVSSLNGVFIGVPGMAPYCASKQAVVGLTESLYGELAAAAPHIHVSVYLSGLVNTNIWDFDRNYPTDAADGPVDSPERRQRIEEWKEWIGRGISIDKAADILFTGLRENKLYIGPRGFTEKHPNLADMIRSRGEDIINENNITNIELKVNPS